MANFCRNNFKCDFVVNEIDRTHQVGKPRDDSIPRAIIVKFVSYQSKLKILKYWRNLKGSKMFVNEDLTLANKNLFNAARRDLPDLSVDVTLYSIL